MQVGISRLVVEAFSYFELATRLKQPNCNWYLISINLGKTNTFGVAPRATIEASSPQDPDGVSLGGRGLQTKAWPERPNRILEVEGNLGGGGGPPSKNNNLGRKWHRINSWGRENYRTNTCYHGVREMLLGDVVQKKPVCFSFADLRWYHHLSWYA